MRANTISIYADRELRASLRDDPDTNGALADSDRIDRFSRSWMRREYKRIRRAGVTPIDARSIVGAAYMAGWAAGRAAYRAERGRSVGHYLFVSIAPCRPLLPGDPGYLERGNDADHLCRDRFEDWVCTRSTGHDGHHAAHAFHTMYARWTREEP